MRRDTIRHDGPPRNQALLALLFLLGCSSNETPTGGTGGSAGTTAFPGAGSAGTGGTLAGATGAGTDSGGTGGSAGARMGDGGTGEFLEVGVCGHRGESRVSDDEFEGFEEYFLIGEEGFGEDICVVRFDVTRVGAAPAGCTDCLWSHLVELGNPSTELDENGVCAESELAFDAARIAELDGARIAYGFVPEFAGHVSVVMKYDEALGVWDAFGNATYDDALDTLKFERRNGICGY